MSEEKNSVEPYRVLFPFGLISAVIGIFLWILFQNRGISFYPRQAHANIMFLAFLWSFISGFLMTAVPKMTSTKTMDYAELFATTLLILIQLILNIRNQIQLSVGVFAMQLLTLIFFLVRRFWVRRVIPFEGFFFLPFAFLQGFLGIVMYYWGSQFQFETFYALSGEALVLNLILGLGSRLIPVISRCPNALMPTDVGINKNRGLYFVLALLLNLGILLDVVFGNSLGNILKLISILLISFKFLGLFKKPTTFTIVGYGLKIGIILLISSALRDVFSPATIAASHLLYIGVFFLITLMVATRVMLAHGQQQLEYESKSVRMFLITLCLVLASILRFYASTDIDGSFMLGSIYVGIFGVALWGDKFFRILVCAK